MKPRSFTPEDDAVIVKARQMSPRGSWDAIAKQLNGPTAKQCCLRWFNHLSSELIPEPWTPEEDRLLVEKINEMGPRWGLIAPSFDERSVTDLRNRWHNHLKSETVHDGTRFVYPAKDARDPDADGNDYGESKTYPKEAVPAVLEEEPSPEVSEALVMNSTPKQISRSPSAAMVPKKMWPQQVIGKRRFTRAEDTVIVEAKRLNPLESWETIAKRLEGRTARQCCSRWTHYLSSELTAEPWTPEEDRLLVDKINETGLRWKLIKGSFEGRSLTDLRNRWHVHIRMETVREGTKFIYTGSDPPGPTGHRKEGPATEGDEPKICLEPARTGILQIELRQATSDPDLMNSTPPQLSRRSPIPGLSERVPPKSGRRSRPFTRAEDTIIVSGRLGVRSKTWDEIAECLHRRTGRQCRRRWTNCLSSELIEEPWTPEEDRLLVEKINEMGQRWTLITPFFDERSVTDLRNRWHNHLKSETVHDGTKFIYSENGHDENNKRKSSPKEAVPAVLEEERTPGASEVLNWAPEPFTNPEERTRNLWDRMTTDDSTDEIFRVIPRD
jgi:hypothetical protein